MDQLIVTGIGKHFDGVAALRGAAFSVREGEVHALVGENGAGKSTLGKIIAGVLRPDAGELRLGGERLRPSDPLDAQRQGIVMIFQELDLFPNLSVAENLAVANLGFGGGGWVRRSRLEAFCRPFLVQVGLEGAMHRRVGELAMGQQQLVAIARALSMRARILVMDEPTSALTDEAVEGLFGRIAALRASGVSIVYVSHKMDEIFRICDRATVLRDGVTVGTRRLAESTVDEIISMMVGRPVDRLARAASHRTAEPALTVRELSADGLEGVSFTLHCGEVLGVAGLVGSGCSALGAALFGLRGWRGGEVLLHGRAYAPRRPRQAMARGVGLVPNDRKVLGLMMQMGVRENATLCRLPILQRGGWVRRGEERAAFDRVAGQTRLKTAGAQRAVRTLSGGNQQKVLLGRWLLMDPDILFLDDPTRGVDIGAKEDIHLLIESLAKTGKAVMMISSELPELLRCCDRILVMNEGRVAGVVDARTTTQEQIMALAARPTGREAGS